MQIKKKGKLCRRTEDGQEELLEHIVDVIARIKERQDALRRVTRHVLTRVAKCIGVDAGISENVLY
jgi:hypothetical protein